MKKNILLITAILIFIALIVTIIFVMKKFVFKNATVPDDLLDDSKLTDEQKKEIVRIAKENKENFQSGWFSRDTAPMKELLTLSDTMFVSVYNEFGIVDKKTLKEWVVDSKDLTNPGIRGAIITRFKDLEKRGIVFETTGKVIFNF